MRRKKTWVEQLQENKPQVYHLYDPNYGRIPGNNPELADFLDDSYTNAPLSGGMPTKIDQEVNRIENDLKQTFRRLSMTDGAQRAFMSALSARVLYAPPPPLISDKVPLWMDRADRKETPPEFIKRVYAQRLGKGLTQADILHLDKQLYFAFHKWLRSNPMPADLDLPTRKQVNDRKLQELGVTAENPSVRPDVAPDLRERMRLNRAVHRRFG